MTETTGLMEPLLPPENTSDLTDLALDLVSKASAFAGMLILLWHTLWVIWFAL